MELLTVSGPLTATELADRLDETPANCSWHLRKLAEHDFVEEAGGGIGRKRPVAGAQRRAGVGRGRCDARRAAGPVGPSSRCCMERQVARLHASRAQLHDDGDLEWAEAAPRTQTPAG